MYRLSEHDDGKSHGSEGTVTDDGRPTLRHNTVFGNLNRIDWTSDRFARFEKEVSSSFETKFYCLEVPREILGRSGCFRFFPA